MAAWNYQKTCARRFIRSISPSWDTTRRQSRNVTEHPGCTGTIAVTTAVTRGTVANLNGRFDLWGLCYGCRRHHKPLERDWVEHHFSLLADMELTIATRRPCIACESRRCRIMKNLTGGQNMEQTWL